MTSDGENREASSPLSANEHGNDGAHEVAALTRVVNLVW